MLPFSQGDKENLIMSLNYRNAQPDFPKKEVKTAK